MGDSTMMKNLLALLVLVCSFPLMASVTVGLVDVQKVLTSIKEGQAVMKTLEKSFNSKKDTLKKDEDKIKKAGDDLKKQAAMLSEQARLTKEREIQEEILKVQGKAADFQREMQKMENDLKRPIIDKLRPIIEDVSKAAGVQMTFELGSAPIIYAESKKDITDDVIKAYDKKHPVK
jgi:outer membrane protein